MRYVVVVFGICLALNGYAEAQRLPDSLALRDVTGLRAQIRQLFVFGQGDTPLAVRDSTGGRIGGFVPSSVQTNSNLIAFLENAIAANIGNTPFSTANPGVTVRFENGAPVLTRGAPGPIFAERAETLGAGRAFVGSSLSIFRTKTLRGVPLDGLQLNFPHVNLQGDICDSVIGSDCTPHGVPEFENEFMQLDLDFELQVSTLSFVFAYGLHDRLDVGVALPIVFTSFRGRSQAQIVPFGAPPVRNFFGGTPDDPQLISDPNFAEGSASGVGDVTARAKLAIAESPSARLAILGEARFATGSEDDLLGTGAFAARGLAIASTTFGRFTPHLNIGYLYRADSLQTDAMWVTAGFDHVLTSWATLAVDLISQLQVGDSNLELPETVILTAPYERVIRPSIVPERRDDIIDGSLGFKFATPSGVTLIANTIWPLNRGGVRSNVILSTGLEYHF